MQDARSRIAPLTGTPPEAFEEALVTDYPPGAGIGRHRDAPGEDREALRGAGEGASQGVFSRGS